MESSLHRALKERYAVDGRNEVSVDGYRIDAIDAEGFLVEIQAAALAAIRPKVARLLENHAVRVVKPVTLAKRIVRRATPKGEEISNRWSPSRGDLIDVFDDFIGLAKLFPHPNLKVEVVGVEVAEIRSPRRRNSRREHVLDRRLLSVGESRELREAADLWKLIDQAPEPGAAFTTKDLARLIGRSLFFAQRVAYCLRLAGAVDDLGKISRHRLYARKALAETHADGVTAHECPRQVPAQRKNRVHHGG